MEKLFPQPINILILINQVNNHICGTIVLFSLSLSLALGTSIRETADEFLGGFVSSNTYCWFFYQTLSFNNIYQGIDGIGISVLRYLYIKKGTWVKYKFGEKRLICLASLINMLVGFALTYMYELENISNRSSFNICKGHSHYFEVKIFYKKFCILKCFQKYSLPSNYFLSAVNGYLL